MISVMETDLTFSLATWAPIYYSCHGSWGLCLIWKLAQVFNLHQRVFQVGTLIWIELKGFSNASPKLQLRFCTKWYQIITMLLEGRVVSYVIAWNMIYTRKYIEPWEKKDFKQSALLDFPCRMHTMANNRLLKLYNEQRLSNMDNMKRPIWAQQ